MQLAHICLLETCFCSLWQGAEEAQQSNLKDTS